LAMHGKSSLVFSGQTFASKGKSNIKSLVSAN